MPSLTHSGAVGRRPCCVVAPWLEWGSLSSGRPLLVPWPSTALGWGVGLILRFPRTSARACRRPSGTGWCLGLTPPFVPQLGEYLVRAKCYLCQLIISSKRGTERGGGNTALRLRPHGRGQGTGCPKTDSPCLTARRPQDSIRWPPHCLREYDAHSPV